MVSRQVARRKRWSRWQAMAERQREVARRHGQEAQLRIAAMAFETHLGMFVTDAEGRILRTNATFRQITGYAAEEIVGHSPRILNSGRHDDHFYQRMWCAIGDKGSWQGEIWNRRRSGEIYPQWLTISAVKDDEGRITNYVATLSDITERKAAEEEIHQLAFYDPLTGLPNRRLLVDRLESALKESRRSGEYGAVMFIDLDNFKTINDSLGHHRGDELLLIIAERLTAITRETDTIARLGGDEFVVMLHDLGLQADEAAMVAERVGEKLLASLVEPCMLGEMRCQVSGSIGITLFTDDQATVNDILQQADLAMYQAKAAGRHALCFFDPAMQARVMERASLEADLRQALADGLLRLFYQVQVDEEGQTTGVEALLRWEHPERGLVSPGVFIPVAEENGLIVPMGLWVLETACRQLAAWAALPATEHLTMAVNVSRDQFRAPDFVARLERILAVTGARPERLKLELTETLFLEDSEDTRDKMQRLKGLGIGFALDDFGTGYSSLAYLKRLPLDQLKIDQSFVRDLLDDPTDATIVTTIITLARSLELEVIAEGVESEEHRRWLAAQGCRAFQGYLFGRPVSVEELSLTARQLPVADLEAPRP
ncbi:EAL domain-containing protein [Halomonas sp. M4R5S39]|uniref:putative bifunctional diguanylate cyclase/phosphodiesterase n=1 Tax=Halomonas kalidii TaxID=3043293 RepID=UPI0024A8A0C3|nr:EAL domain-containing protein [Halomonas kalidii]MDI5987251.1 EAL domain-containing protein [Halomonas kalidii]